MATSRYIITEEQLVKLNRIVSGAELLSLFGVGEAKEVCNEITTDQYLFQSSQSGKKDAADIRLILKKFGSEIAD